MHISVYTRYFICFFKKRPKALDGSQKKTLHLNAHDLANFLVFSSEIVEQFYNNEDFLRTSFIVSQEASSNFVQIVDFFPIHGRDLWFFFHVPPMSLRNDQLKELKPFIWKIIIIQVRILVYYQNKVHSLLLAVSKSVYVLKMPQISLNLK